MKGSTRIFALSLIFTVSITGLQAQTQDSYEYQSEFTWGINKNTYGGLIGGFVFKKARKLKDPKWLETYGLELMNVKHPQEVRKTSSTGNFYIQGKQNYLYALRLQYGRDLILFKKAPQQGVEIKAVFAAGPTLGFLAPYYLEYSVSGNDLSSYFAQYEPENGDEILGTGRLFQGIGESQLKLGLNLKAAINFELGTVKSSVTGFEAGFLLDTYSKDIVLMPTTENYSVFPTLFISIFYGNRK
jgi:hypothetical protein